MHGNAKVVLVVPCHLVDGCKHGAINQQVWLLVQGTQNLLLGMAAIAQVICGQTKPYTS